MPKLMTYVYRNNDDKLVKGSPTESDFCTEELSDIVDEYEIMCEFLNKEKLMKKYEKFKSKIEEE